MGEIKVKLLEEEQIEMRAVGHERNKKTMDYFQKVGSSVRALYGDDENDVTWYDAVVDRVIWRDDETGSQFTRPKFVVTFPEYGNTETVSLGEMDMPGGQNDNWKGNGNYQQGRGRGAYDRNNNTYDRNYRGNRHSERDYASRDRYDNRRSRSRSRDRSSPTFSRGGRSDTSSNNNYLMEEVKRREQENVIARGRDYSSRPNSFRQSFSPKSNVGHGRRDNSYSGDPYYESRKQEKRHQQDEAKEQTSSPEAPKRQKTAEELAAIKEKKRKLMAKYG